MPDPAPTHRKLPRAVKWLLITLVTLLIIFALLIAMVPMLANMAAIHWLEKQGITAQIEGINFDFNDGIVEILNARGENAAQQGFKLQRFYIDLQWLPLTDRVVHIDKIEIEGLSLVSTANQQGLTSIAGISMLKKTAENNDVPEQPAARWRIKVADIRVTDIDVCHRIDPPQQQLCLTWVNFNWQGLIDYDMAAVADSQPAVQGSLQFASVKFEQSDELQTRSIDIQQLDLQALAMQGPDDAQFKVFSVDGLVVVPGLSESGAKQWLRLQQLALSQAHFKNQQLKLNEFKLTDVQVGATTKGEQEQILLINKALTVSTVQYTVPRSVTIKNIAMDETQFVPGGNASGAKQIARFTQFLIDDLRFDNDRLEINKVAATGLGADIYRDKQGHLSVNRYLPLIRPRPDQQAEPATDTEQTSSSPITVKVDVVEMIDSQPVEFTDQSLESPFQMRALIKQFKATDIDTARAEQNSHIQFEVSTDQHGSVQLEGDAQLLSEARNFDIDGKITGLDLRPVGSYVESGLGHRIRSGQLNAKLKLVANKGQLDSLLDLNLKQFQLKKLEPGEKEKVDESTGLPLSTALNLLRDRDKSIHLKIPVTGDINSPEFDPSSAINKALSKAMTAAIINYYTPFGLVTVVEGIFNLATALRFEPILFEAGSDAPQAASVEYLDKLDELMTERPQIYLSVCGYSNKDDVKALAPDVADQQLTDKTKLKPERLEQLTRLSNSRSEYVKTYLIDKGIAADRLIICDGEFDLDAVSGVVVSI